MAKKRNVLFLCGGNSCRSQMAEAFLRKHASDRFEVSSAGIRPSRIHPLTIEVMREVGIDLEAEGHRAKTIDGFVTNSEVDILIAVCDAAAAACPTIPGARQRILWPFDDPPTFEGTDEEKLDRFREVRDQIDERIQRWVRDFDKLGY